MRKSISRKNQFMPYKLLADEEVKCRNLSKFSLSENTQNVQSAGSTMLPFWKQISSLNILSYHCVHIPSGLGRKSTCILFFIFSNKCWVTVRFATGESWFLRAVLSFQTWPCLLFLQHFSLNIPSIDIM